jgi:integrase
LGLIGGGGLHAISGNGPGCRGAFASPDVAEKTLANIRAAVTRAVRQYGDVRPPITRRIEFAPHWRALLDRIPVAYQRQALHRLAAFCSVMGVAPAQVGRETLLGLHAALEAEEFVKTPRRLLKSTITNWNRCVRTVPNWPQIRLTSPFKVVPYTLPLAAFPMSLQAEVQTWASRMTDPDPLDLDAPARPLRPATVEHRILEIRQFASALVHRQDLTPDKITGLAVLFTPERFKAALRFFLDRAGGRPTARLHNSANALRLLARHHCQIDPATLTVLEQLCSRIDPRDGRKMTTRNRARLQQFDDPRNVARLLRFPEQQVAKARKEKNPLRAAKRVERALIVALLIHCGLRIGTLQALEITDFRWTRPDRQGVCHLSVPGRKTKTNRPLAFELTEPVAALLRLYLAHRPRLGGADGPYLFPGQSGGMRSTKALRDGIVQALHREAGLVMHPHLFRHAIAKIAVERDPGAYLAVSRMLGHTTLDTTMAHYLGTEGKAAARHLDRLLAEAADQPLKRQR